MIFSPTVPSAAPTLICIHDVASFNITVHWDSVNCIEQNGDITGYSVRYRIDGIGKIQTLNISENINEAIISGLVSATNYSIEVAAVNRVGTGVYSIPVYFITKGTGMIWTQSHSNYSSFCCNTYCNNYFRTIGKSWPAPYFLNYM